MTQLAPSTVPPDVVSLAQASNVPNLYTFLALTDQLTPRGAS